MRRLALYTTLVLATLAGLWGVWRFREVWVLFLLSLILGATARPIIYEMANRTRFSVQTARGLVFGGIAFLILMFFLLLGGALWTEFGALLGQAATQYETSYRAWLNEEGTLFQSLAERLPPPSAIYEGLTSEESDNSMLPLLITGGRNLIYLLASGVTVFFLSLYWSIDQARFERLWLSLLPAHRRIQARQVWRKMEDSVGYYLRSEVAQSILMTFFLAVGYGLMGFKFPLLLAIWGGLMQWLPFLGVIFVVVPAFFIGYDQSVGLSILAPLYTIGIASFLEFYIEPRLTRVIPRSFLLTLILVAPLTLSLGLVGLISAPLLAITVQTLISEWHQISQRSKTTSINLESLQERYQSFVEESVAESYSPKVTNVLKRLGSLLTETRNEI
jgi:predicted PurR-regulated permease PerM